MTIACLCLPAPLHRRFHEFPFNINQCEFTTVIRIRREIEQQQTKHEFSMNGRENRLFAAHQIKNDLRMNESFEFDELTIHENVAQRLPFKVPSGSSFFASILCEIFCAHFATS